MRYLVTPALATLALLSACGGPASAPLNIEVQGAEGQPIRGAHVQVRPSNARHPLDIMGMFSKDLDAEAWVQTGPDGRARTSAYKESPMDLVVVAPGFAPWRRFFNAHPAAAGPTAWLSSSGPEGDGPTIQVRCSP